MSQIEFEPKLAKPGIPEEAPRRRELPDVAPIIAPVRESPKPEIVPLKPAKEPQVPVPA